MNKTEDLKHNKIETSRLRPLKALTGFFLINIICSFFADVIFHLIRSNNRYPSLSLALGEIYIFSEWHLLHRYSNQLNQDQLRFQNLNMLTLEQALSFLFHPAKHHFAASLPLKTISFMLHSTC